MYIWIRKIYIHIYVYIYIYIYMYIFINSYSHPTMPPSLSYRCIASYAVPTNARGDAGCDRFAWSRGPTCERNPGGLIPRKHEAVTLLDAAAAARPTRVRAIVCMFVWRGMCQLEVAGGSKRYELSCRVSGYVCRNVFVCVYVCMYM